MTDPSPLNPPPERVVASTPILAATLRWGGLLTAGLVVLGAIIGFLVAGADGAWSALAGVLTAAVFLGITALSILIANRWFGDPLYVQLFFAIVLGGWLLKLGLFVVIMIVLSGQPWVEPMVFFLSIVTGVVATLVIDVIVITKMRLPNVSDASLPSEAPTDHAPGVQLPTVVPEDRAPGRHHIVPEPGDQEGPAEQAPRS
jgi:hypothetical protein